MNNLDWKNSEQPRATHKDLDRIEAEMAVKIPEILRTILTVYGGIMPERNGEMAEVVTLPNPETGEPELVGFLAEFTEPYTAISTCSWLEEQFNFRPEKIIQFGSDGGSEMFLCYDNDPTNANPEIRNVYGDVDTLEEAWRFFAPDIETLICNLKTKSEARALGILKF